MSRFEFDKILEKYLAGVATPEEEKLILKWYKSFINDSGIEISAIEKKAIEQKIWSKLKDKIYKKPTVIRTKNKPVIYRAWFKYAAACLILLVGIKGLLTYFSVHKPPVPNQQFTHIQVPQKYQSVYNDKNSNITIQLADGSTVELQPQSALHYPSQFSNTTRDVYLTGNAFFKITHDTAHHFIVHTDEGLVAEVLGTSFYVLHEKRNNKIDKVEVNVVTGKVFVYKEENATAINSSSFKKILLTPNQKVDFKSQNDQFVISLVEDPKPVKSDQEYKAPPPVAFIFEDASLSEVLKDIANTYGISIEVENSKLNDCHFTGDISRQPLYDKLHIICEATQSSYEVKGTSIYIKGAGCD